jgi:hypothetical protein
MRVLVIAGQNERIEMVAEKRLQSTVGSLLLSVITSVLLLVGCSSGQSKQAAVEALNKGWHRESAMMFVKIGRLSQSCADIIGFEKDEDLTKVTNFRAAQKAGLITIAPDGPGFWKVELVNPNPKVVENLKTIKHTVRDGCDSMGFVFPVASKAVAEVLNVHEITSQTAEVEYTWKWTLVEPGVKLVDNLTHPELIELNAKLQDRNHQPIPNFNLADMTQSGTPRPGKATLKKSGDGWVMDE